MCFLTRNLLLLHVVFYVLFSFYCVLFFIIALTIDYCFFSQESHLPRKPRFLKRNKRSACLRAEQLRLLHERKVILSSGIPAVSALAVAETSTGCMLNPGDNISGNIADMNSLWSKRPPERMGNSALVCPGGEKYFVNDRDEIKLNASGRQVFVINKNLKFFKLDSVRKAKMVRIKI